MSSEKPETVYRSQYREPDYVIDSVDLAFDIHEGETEVRAVMAVRRRPGLLGDSPPLVLDGEALTLEEVSIDGRPLSEREYGVTDSALRIESPPERFTLETVVTIVPERNTALSGLYKSSGTYCTQCEAMGFRRITYFLDRPDVMARYTVSIEADAERYPVLLSNGNRIDVEQRPEGRHRVHWSDPHPKPSYLFALVAGDLRCHRGRYETASGRTVELEIWVEPQNVEKCDHALGSLKRAMKWDEQKFGLEYDLDVYMIVAVGDFNMGAMENKGLNIFNSKYVLALPETATDPDYEAIEAVIAHEYFHNWTGNRVTCRDWFQLTLKEGLTVFRDQQFTRDMTSAAVKRIDDVKALRLRQFPEDEGPMAHPIRPESYISMDNFYTSTVYDKGAEVIRMYHTLLGEDGFRRGMDLYFERHDGQAVTCDDFRDAMATAGAIDLGQFERWYQQAGTPRVRARTEWRPAEGVFVLDLDQDYPPTAFAIQRAGERRPLHMPVKVGLLDATGSPVPLHLEGEDPSADGHGQTERVLELRAASQQFVFTGLASEPVPSLFRDFSAPIRLEMDWSDEQLAFLMARDTDPFNRWEAGQTLGRRVLLGLASDCAGGRPLRLPASLAGGWTGVLHDPELDGSLKALALELPDERELALAMDVIDPDALFEARGFAMRSLTEMARSELLERYAALAPSGPYRNDRASIDRRRLRNALLGFLCALDQDDTSELAWRQFTEADNMTDKQAALELLVHTDSPRRHQAIAEFYDVWKGDPLVVDKWFAAQALSTRPDAFVEVQALTGHPAFSLSNPNRLRSLVATFCARNHVRFHRADGAAYAWLADIVLEIHAKNPQLGARMASLFNPWRRYDPGRQALMRTQLERIAGQPGLSKDVFEIVSRALAD